MAFRGTFGVCGVNYALFVESYQAAVNFCRTSVLTVLPMKREQLCGIQGIKDSNGVDRGL